MTRVLAVGVIVILSLQSDSVRAQLVIEGTVVDAESGISLPGATVQAKDTFNGTVTNAAGRFRIDVPALPVRLVARFIGYDSLEMTLDSASNNVTLRLDPSVLILPELIVSGEDPAVEIMRRVIAAKQVWKKDLRSYRVEAYNRFRLENDSGIVSIWESGTLAFWDDELGSREVAVWQKGTDNAEIESLMPAALFIKNLYEDNIEVGGHHLMGVTHPEAVDFYQFRLVRARSQDEQIVYDIDVRPKSRLSSGFVGKISVLDEDYAMISADLRPGEAFYFPPPFKRISVTYRQQYLNFDSAVWLPVDLRASSELDIALSGLFSIPTIKLEQFSRLAHFELNIPVPDSLYQQDNFVVEDTTLVNSLELSEPEDLAIPLTEGETQAYTEIDSTMTMDKAFKPSGLLARFVQMDDDRRDERNRRRSGRNSGKGKGLDLSLHTSPDLRYNRVEGLFAGAAIDVDPISGVTIGGRVGYSQARRKWSWAGNIEMGRQVRFSIGYSGGVERRYLSSIHGLLTNSLNTISLGHDYYDYVNRETYFVKVSSSLSNRFPVKWELAYSDATDRSIQKKIESSLIGNRSDLRPNARVSDGIIRSGRIRLSYTKDSIPYGIGPEYRFDVVAETSIGPTKHTLSRFSRINGSILWRINTFYGRRLIPNTLDFRISGGTFSGTLPRQRFGIVDGTSSLSVFGGLKTRHQIPYEGSSYFSVVWEHDFRTVIFEKLGWTSLARKGINLIVFGGHARTWDVQKIAGRSSREGLFDRGFHHELGWSVSGLFSLLRIDFAHRLDRPDFSVGVSVARIF